MNRVLDGLVLDWEDFDALNDLVQEELTQDIGRVAARALLPREAEVDSVFHHEEALLALGTLEALEKLTINLRHGPALNLSCSALLVNEGVAKLGAD